MKNFLNDLTGYEKILEAYNSSALSRKAAIQKILDARTVKLCKEEATDDEHARKEIQSEIKLYNDTVTSMLSCIAEMRLRLDLIEEETYRMLNCFPSADEILKIHSQEIERKLNDRKREQAESRICELSGQNASVLENL